MPEKDPSHRSGGRPECPRETLRKNGGGKVTKAKAGKYEPLKIHTPFRQSFRSRRETYRRGKVAAGERDSERRHRRTKGWSCEDPHTVPAVGIEPDVRPIGEGGGGR